MHFHNRILLINNTMEIKPNEKFQWIKGDNIGDVEIVERVAGNKVNFESGRRLMKTVFAEFVKPIKSQEDLMVIQKGDAQSQQNNNAVKDLPASSPVPQNTVETQADPDNLTISNSKILDAVKASKKNKVLNLKTKVKYLDDSLYEFLRSAHPDFDKVYKKMLVEQANEELSKQIDEFLETVHNKS